MLILCVEKGHRHCHKNYFMGRVLGEDGYEVGICEVCHGPRMLITICMGYQEDARKS